MVDNVSPKQTWDALQADPGAQLVDVRTDVEWRQIGLPDLRTAGKQAVLISWQYAPAGNLNPDFVADLRAAGLDPAAAIFFLCRSGVRSLSAAAAAAAAGFAHTYNIENGFEGPPDAMGRRGTVAGWQADGLPWRR